MQWACLSRCDPCDPTWAGIGGWTCAVFLVLSPGRWGCGQGVLRKYYSSNTSTLWSQNLASFCMLSNSLWLNFVSEVKTFPFANISMWKLDLQLILDKKHFLMALWYFCWPALDCTWCHQCVCMCLPTHSSAKGEKGKSTFAGRWGTPISDDEMAAAWLQCPHLPHPAPHRVGSATSLILSVNASVV